MATSGLGTISIDGLVSNLKTSELISKLIELERRPIRILQQRQQDLTNRKVTWSDLSARMLALQGMIVPLTTVPTFQVKSATSSDSNILTAGATSNATAASYTVRVQQLALNHSVATDSHLTTETGNALRTMLTNEGIPGAAALTAIETISIRVGSTSKSITVDTTTDTLSDLLADINTEAGDLVTATVINDSPTTQKLVLTSKTSGRAGEVYFTDSANGLLQKLGLLDNGTTVTGVEITEPFTGAGDGHGTGAPDPAGFTEVAGTWEIEANVYDQSAAGVNASREDAAGALSGSNTYSNVEASVTMNLQDDLAGDNGVLWIRANDALTSGYMVSVTGDEAPAGFTKWKVELFRVVGGVPTQIGSSSYTFQNNTNYTVTARAEGQNVRVMLGGQEVIDFTDTDASAPTSGKVALATNNSHTHFDNLEVRRISAKNVLQQAQDAVFTLNNIPIVSSSNTNATAINGVTMNLISAAPATDVSLTVASDTSSVKASIQSFVSQYNSLIGFFRSQLQFEEGQTTIGSLFGDGLLLNVQNQLQNLGVSNIDPLLRTEFAGLGDGNLGDIFGDFTLKNEITSVSDVRKVLVDSTEYLVRAEGGAVANGGNQVEVRLNGQLRFFDNNGVAFALANGAVVNVDYMPAEKVAGSGGAVSGDYNLAKTIAGDPSYIRRVIADVGAITRTFTVIGQNTLFPGGSTTMADGFYAEVLAPSDNNNGALRFLEVSGGGTVITAINVDNGTVKALYRGTSDYGSLAQIGVSVNDITDPTLKIDNTILDAALTSNLQSVQELFNDYTESVANALNTFLVDATETDGVIGDIQQGITDEIDSIQDVINQKEEILSAHQVRLQKQFAQMEATLGLLQAQGVWLQQQISKLPSGFTLPGTTKSGG